MKQVTQITPDAMKQLKERVKRVVADGIVDKSAVERMPILSLYDLLNEIESYENYSNSIRGKLQKLHDLVFAP